MIATIKFAWLLLLPVSLTLSAYGQSMPDAIIKKIDTLFAQWNSDRKPGYMVGIIKNDSLVFSKGYGMANLEYGIPITNQTVFYVASVSKQFTGYCIQLLVRQKKINLDEDIRVYLPWFPDLKQKITVQNLLNHTSGIRDHLNMIAIAGLGIDGVLTNDLVVRTLNRQQGLNFTPGERYSYSNSNYVLLAEIVKSVSGKSFRKFADSAIFRPLGMRNTHFHDTASELLANRAVSYWRDGNGIYSNAFQNVYTVGDGGLMTTVQDAARWIRNFYDPQAGDKQTIEALTRTGRLLSGKRLSYASGISVSEEGGWRVYSHGGTLHGYSAILSVYPELKTGFIIFGNTRTGDIGNKVNELARLLILPKKRTSADTVSPARNTQSVVNDSTFLKKYSGEYMSDDGYLLNIFWQDRKLGGSGFGQYFETVGKQKSNTFLFPSTNNPLTKLILDEEATKPEFLLEFPDEQLHFTQLDKSVIIKAQDVVGEYYCPELSCTYKISMKEGQLVLSSAYYPDSKLMLRERHMIRDDWFMNHLKIRLDQNRVTGFEVNSGNVMHLLFTKVN